LFPVPAIAVGYTPTRSNSCNSRSSFLTASLLLFISSGLVNAQFTAPPQRKNAAGGNVACNNTCPPGDCTRNAKGEITSFTKVPPDPNLTNDADLKDQDKNGDGRVDYFIGQWKFVSGVNDLIVRKWCIEKPAGAGGTLGDFFTIEVLSSLNGQIQQPPLVRPQSPT